MSTLPEAASTKNIDDALHEVCELLQAWENRLTIDNLALSERYIEGKVDILLDVRLSVGSAFKDYRAVFQGIHPSWSHGDWRTDKKLLRPWRRQDQSDAEVPICGPYRNDRLVFVQSIKLVNEPEKFAPTFVWLQTPDQPVGFCADALYLSRGVGFKFFGRSPDRESRLPSGLSLVDNHELPSELVKSCPKVVHDITDDPTKTRRNWFFDLNPIDLIAGFRIIVGDDFIWAAFEECSDFCLQITDMAFGPFNFDPDPV